jgi:hypothetical protein
MESVTAAGSDGVLSSIRIDTATQKGSVYDVVMAVTGCDQAWVTKTYSRLCERYPDFKAPGLKVSKIKINDSGRETPVADAATLIEIAFLLLGNKAREFCRAGAEKVRRVLGGDLTFIDETERRHEQVSGTAQEAFLLGSTSTSQLAVRNNAVELTASEELEKAFVRTLKKTQCTYLGTVGADLGKLGISEDISRRVAEHKRAFGAGNLDFCLIGAWATNQHRRVETAFKSHPRVQDHITSVDLPSSRQTEIMKFSSAFTKEQAVDLMRKLAMTLNSDEMSWNDQVEIKKERQKTRRVQIEAEEATKQREAEEATKQREAEEATKQREAEEATKQREAKEATKRFKMELKYKLEQERLRLRYKLQLAGKCRSRDRSKERRSVRQRREYDFCEGTADSESVCPDQVTELVAAPEATEILPVLEAEPAPLPPPPQTALTSLLEWLKSPACLVDKSDNTLYEPCVEVYNRFCGSTFYSAAFELSVAQFGKLMVKLGFNNRDGKKKYIQELGVQIRVIQGLRLL